MKNHFKRTISSLLLVFLLLNLSACNLRLPGTTRKFEGPGYKSASEAATAYAEYLCKSDFDSMLSTFAIETYTENYDLKAYITEKEL